MALEEGVDPRLRDHKGKTPQEIALNEKRLELAKKLGDVCLCLQLSIQKDTKFFKKHIALILAPSIADTPLMDFEVMGSVVLNFL